jgi:hypothetical protein
MIIYNFIINFLIVLTVNKEKLELELYFSNKLPF